MGETADEKKHDSAEKAEKEEKHEKKDKEKHADKDDDEGDKAKDKKKKDKDSKDKKKKDPEDKKDPAKLKAKLEKIEGKMQALQIKKEEILNLIREAEKNGSAANVSSDGAKPPPSSA